MAGGAGLVLVCGGVQLVTATAYNVVLARSLGVSDFGLFVLLTTLTTLAAQGALRGRDSAVLRFGGIAAQARDRDVLRSVVWSSVRAVATASVVVAMLGLAAGLLLRTVLGDSEVTLAAAVVSLSVPLTAVATVSQKALRVAGRSTTSVLLQYVLTPLSRLVFAALVLTRVDDGLVAASAAYAAAELVTLTVTGLVLVRQLPARAPLADVPGLRRFSAAMMTSSLLGSANEQSETLALAVLGTKSELGTFSAARKLSLLLSSLLSSVGLHLNPLVASLHAAGRHDELAGVFRTCTRWMVTLALPFCLLEVLLARELVALYGQDFEAAALPLAIMATGQLVNVATGTSGGLLAMTGHARLTVQNTVAVLVLSLVLDVVLIPYYGAIGAAAANACAVAALNVTRAVQVRRLLGLRLYDRTFLKPSAAAVVAASAVLLLDLPTGTLSALLLGSTTLFGVYAAVLALLRVEPADRHTFRMLRSHRGATDD